MSVPPLTAEQVARYREEGYLVVPGLLTDAEIQAFREHQAGPANPEWKALGLRRHTADPQWKRIAGHPRVTAIVRQLLDGAPMVVQTMYLAKTPGGGAGIALHQDTHYIRNEPNTLMACWLAFSDTDRDNGGLCVVPGSHRGPLLDTQPPRDAKEHVSWVTDYPMRAPDGREWTESMHAHEIRDLDPGRILYLAVPRGSGVFFTGKTVHGSFSNRSSDRPRLAFATHYVREGTWVYRCDIQDLVPA